MAIERGMSYTTINFLARVRSVPSDLGEPLPPERAYLRGTSELYQFVIDSRILWRIHQIDERGQHWIEVNRMGEDGEPEYHSLALDEGSFDRIECDPYEVEDERGRD